MQPCTYFRSSAVGRPRIAPAIARDIHPLNDLRVLRYLKHATDHSDEARDACRLLRRADAAALAGPAFRDAAPEHHSDAF